MGIALLLARLTLALVFTVAGLAKLVDLAGSRQALRDFGVPARLTPSLGILLPLAELAVAVALIPTASAWWAAVGALLLLLLFVAGISFNLARGRTPDCHCFGQLHSAPAGWSTLLRNLLLAAIAGFVVGFGRTNAGVSAVDWLGFLTVTQRIELLVGVVVLALLVTEGWLLLHLLRQNGRLLTRLEAVESELASGGTAPRSSPTAVPTAGLPIGSPAPGFALAGLLGETITLDFLCSSGKPLILVFSDPSCGPCTALMPEISRWQRDYVGKLTLVLVSRGTPESNRAKAGEHETTLVLLQRDREVAEAYQAHGTPSAVLVHADGTVGSELAQGADAIRSLVAGAVGLPMLRALQMTATPNGNGHAAAPSQSASLKVEDPAPTFTLPDLSGKPVSLSDFHGSQTLVLFWNPGCGFCQRVLEDLKVWEMQPPEGAPKLLVISTGTVEANQEMGLQSPVLLDQSFTVGPMFGANGTPMALLIDVKGRIASDLAAGGPAALALIQPDHGLMEPEIFHN